jgi:hypothetical protein
MEEDGSSLRGGTGVTEAMETELTRVEAIFVRTLQRFNKVFIFVNG